MLQSCVPLERREERWSKQNTVATSKYVCPQQREVSTCQSSSETLQVWVRFVSVAGFILYRPSSFRVLFSTASSRLIKTGSLVFKHVKTSVLINRFIFQRFVVPFQMLMSRIICFSFRMGSASCTNWSYYERLKDFDFTTKFSLFLYFLLNNCCKNLLKKKNYRNY